MLGFKLFEQRKDGSLGPLFINKRQRIEVGVEYQAETHATKGFAVRHGWHLCSKPVAPHLTKGKAAKRRVWCLIEFHEYQEHKRPAAQGGLWFTAERMRVMEIMGPCC